MLSKKEKWCINVVLYLLIVGPMIVVTNGWAFRYYVIPVIIAGALAGLLMMPVHRAYLHIKLRKDVE
ncbi:hypothetical protein [Paenibacillus taichungensis]|uniref:hypothetical protein n=1 Tax=Paenibacillus taichungensis TaxID=484184 RepID=UPI0035D59574